MYPKRNTVRLCSDLHGAVGTLDSVYSVVGGGKKLRGDALLRISQQDTTSVFPRKEIIVSRRLKEDFIAETLIPHMDRLITRFIVAHTPAMLAQLAQCYAVYAGYRRSGFDNGALIERLMDTIKYRMPGFEAMDIVNTLPSCYVLAPDDYELFVMFLERINQKNEDFSALNLICVLRVYGRLIRDIVDKDGDLVEHGFFVRAVYEWILPRLSSVLSRYQPQEIVDLLMALAVSSKIDTSVVRDCFSLIAILPQLERVLEDLPFILRLDSFWALTRIGVVHESLVLSVVNDLETILVDDLPLRYTCRLVWLLSKVNKRIPSKLIESVWRAKSYILPSDLARLVQSGFYLNHPEYISLLKLTISRLMDEVIVKDEILSLSSRSAVVLILFSACRLSFHFPKDADFYNSLFDRLFGIFMRNDSLFSEQEIVKIIHTLHLHKRRNFHALLPLSWKPIITSVLFHNKKIQ